jgi:hypothetical protein
MSKEAVGAYFKIPLQYSPEVTEEQHKTLEKSVSHTGSVVR